MANNGSNPPEKPAPFTFSVGEAFPADDPVALWVSTLLMVADDLYRFHRVTRETVFGDPGEHDNTVYWMMLTVSHMREAAKFLDPDACELTRSRDVSWLLGILPAEAQELHKRVLSQIRSWKNSSWILHRVAGRGE